MTKQNLPITNYTQAWQYLDFLTSKGLEQRDYLRLERIKHLLKLLGNPQQKFDSVHIAGTSGKGSVAVLTSFILSQAGTRTGLFLSPHLQSVTERIQINNRLIPVSDFVQLLEKMRPYIEEVNKRGSKGYPTYFETLTALAFTYFAQKKVAIAVVEVGLGGRLDATNVLNPLVNVITTIDYDHTHLLGKSLTKIAGEKCGIIKPGKEVITAETKLRVLRVIEKKCQAKKAKLTTVGQNQDIDWRIKKASLVGSVFDVRTSNHFYKNLQLPLLGEHQVSNAAVTIGAIEELSKKGYNMAERDIRLGLKRAKFSGRIEVVKKSPLLILDGAHNPGKIKALVQTIEKYLGCKKIILVLGVKEKKQITKMLRILLPLAKLVIITQAQQAAGAIKPEIISKKITKLKPSIKKIIISDPLKAINKALGLANKKDLVIVTGSLYLVGEVRNKWFTIPGQIKKKQGYEIK